MTTCNRSCSRVLMFLIVCISSAHANTLLDKKLDLIGSTEEIYSELCQSLAGSCGLIIDDSLAPIIKRSSFSQTAVRDILRNIVPPGGPYMWRMDGRVLNIAPKYVFDGKIKSLSRVDSWQFKDELSVSIAGRILAKSGFSAASDMPTGRYVKVNLELNSITTMQALNRVIEADGMAYWVIVRSTKTATEYYYAVPSIRASGGIRFPAFR